MITIRYNRGISTDEVFTSGIQMPLLHRQRSRDARSGAAGEVGWRTDFQILGGVQDGRFRGDLDDCVQFDDGTVASGEDGDHIPAALQPNAVAG